MVLASKFTLTCRKCKHKEQSHTSNINRGAMDVNRRMVLAMRLIGCGLEPLKHFCCTMNMPGSLSESSSSGHVTILRRCAKEDEKSMTKAVDDTRHLYEANPDGTVDIGVSGDGTWRKRGYSSFHCVGTRISIFSGKVVDISVKSSYCRACTMCQKKKKALQNIMSASKHMQFHKYYSGSSGGMEVSSMTCSRGLWLYDKQDMSNTLEMETARPSKASMILPIWPRPLGRKAGVHKPFVQKNVCSPGKNKI